jgi:hypothetical protein
MVEVSQSDNLAAVQYPRAVGHTQVVGWNEGVTAARDRLQFEFYWLKKLTFINLKC